MCSSQPFFCSLALSRICALAEDVAVDARDVWGLQCNSSVFVCIWAISIPHPAVDLYDNFNCCWWIYLKFLLFRSRWGVRSWSNRASWPSTLLWHLHGRQVLPELLPVTFSSMVFWESFPNPKPGNALFAGAIDNHCTPTKPDQLLGICKRNYVRLSRLTFWNVQLNCLTCHVKRIQPIASSYHIFVSKNCSGSLPVDFDTFLHRADFNVNFFKSTCHPEVLVSSCSFLIL